LSFIIDQQITLDMVKNALLFGSPKVIKLLLRQDSSNVVIQRIKADWIKKMLSIERGRCRFSHVLSLIEVYYTNSNN
jgi:hypothetical protein